METFIRRQAFLIILSFALGALWGFFYDLIRPFRRRCGRVGRGTADALFCLMAAASLFAFAMGAGNGRLGQWELSFALAGFLSWLYTLSDTLGAFFDREAEKLILKSRKIGSGIEKTEKSVKKTFKKIRKCYMIKDKIEKECETDFH